MVDRVVLYYSEEASCIIASFSFQHITNNYSQSTVKGFTHKAYLYIQMYGLVTGYGLFCVIQLTLFTF